MITDEKSLREEKYKYLFNYVVKEEIDGLHPSDGNAVLTYEIYRKDNVAHFFKRTGKNLLEEIIELQIQLCPKTKNEDVMYFIEHNSHMLAIEKLLSGNYNNDKNYSEVGLD